MIAARVDLGPVRSTLVGCRGLCNHALLDADGLCRHASERGIAIFNGDVVRNLWSIGLLRADHVESKATLDVDRLRIVSRDNDVIAYCDDRLPLPRDSGFGSAFADADVIDADPLFHPYRLYVLHHVERVFRAEVSSTQYLSWSQGEVKILQRRIEHLDEWTAKEEFRERFDHWNQVAELAIALEPLSSAAVSGAQSEHEPGGTHEINLQALRQEIDALLRQLGEAGVSEFRSELGRTAEWIDQNKNLHVLLRLMSNHERRKLRGALGASVEMLSMAEVIRRAAEVTFDKHLPEEDQIGLGTWFKGARQLVYGTERVFDAPRRVLRDYLSSMGLDFGTKVRCYVEGLTEYAALSSGFGDASGVEFVNLRANVVERGGKGLSFIDSIRTDAQAHVFTVVVLDGDRDDYVRALRKAAQDSAFLGRYFISCPDVEFANFTSTELLDIVVERAETDEVQLCISPEARYSILQATSAKSFERVIQDELGFQLKKDEW